MGFITRQGGSMYWGRRQRACAGHVPRGGRQGGHQPYLVDPPSLRGRGVAGRLMEEAVSRLRAEGRKARATCSYMR